MSLTKYIAPAIEIYAGIETGGLAGGAMIAGGSMSAVGTATHNQDLSTAGEVVGALGGLGAATGVGTAPIDSSNIFGSAAPSSASMPAGAVAQNADGTFVDASGAVMPPAAPSGIPSGAVAQNASGQYLDSSGAVIPPTAPSGIPTGAVGQNADGTFIMKPPPTPPTTPPGGGGIYDPQIAANNAAIATLGKYNLIAGVAGGIGQAYSAQQQAAMAQQMEQQRMNIANTAAGSGIVTPVNTVPTGGTGLLAVAPASIPNVKHAL